ncbi:MAG: plasmid stability protein [Rhodocyclales bacterium RIFCSPLOWO2_02_FULL_63_24]|nr:MAG: plasmid stability protein [Rhodocyclales bacterium GWA2_65_19]OHC72998.1 MAG: plasmid stability protein [Rhodocyclales bacterium RIFCSPLOWO2_02_FULL_63_24]
MPATLTLKCLPDRLYERLEAVAARNGRSTSEEAVACLDAALPVARLAPGEVLSRARRIRAELKVSRFRAADLENFKRQGCA